MSHNMTSVFKLEFWWNCGLLIWSHGIHTQGRIYIRKDPESTPLDLLYHTKNICSPVALDSQTFSRFTIIRIRRCMQISYYSFHLFTKSWSRSATSNAVCSFGRASLRHIASSGEIKCRLPLWSMNIWSAIRYTQHARFVSYEYNIL